MLGLDGAVLAGTALAGAVAGMGSGYVEAPTQTRRSVIAFLLYTLSMRRFNIDAAPELIHAARRDAGLTQTQLAERAGLRQPSLAQMESGRRSVSDEMLERVLRAADYRPSIPLAAHADEISASARAHGFANPRVFGSALRGEDTFDSDIDLLVTPAPGTDLFDLALFAAEVKELTGFPVEAVADTSVPDALKSAVREAVPL